MEPGFLARLRGPLVGQGLRVTGLSVEKVLVDTARNVLGAGEPAGKRIPFDAQAWLVLEVAK
jgi:hypothetical protein